MEISQYLHLLQNTQACLFVIFRFLYSYKSVRSEKKKETKKFTTAQQIYSAVVK